MPLVDYSLRIVADLMKKLDKERDASRPGQMLTLACPDVVASRETVRKIFGARVDTVPARKDGQLTINWHKAHSVTKEILDTQSLFNALGYTMTSLDVVEGRGGEIMHDLSDPLPAGSNLHDRFDLVFDCVSNQVFNVAQAWWTLVSCCRVGGYVVSVTPVQMVNQGFWNISPAAYQDFCDANGMSLLYSNTIGVYTRLAGVQLNTRIRERGVSDDTMNIAVMQKTEHRSSPAWPVMSKFKKYPKCQLPSLVPE